MTQIVLEDKDRTRTLGRPCRGRGFDVGSTGRECSAPAAGVDPALAPRTAAPGAGA